MRTQAFHYCLPRQAAGDGITHAGTEMMQAATYVERKQGRSVEVFVHHRLDGVGQWQQCVA